MSQREQTGLLFGEPTEAVARAHDPETAQAAAKSVPVNEMESAILAALRKYPNGLTSYELADVTGLSLVTVSPRMRPLVRKGLAEDSGENRPTPGGSKAIVWKAIR